MRAWHRFAGWVGGWSLAFACLSAHGADSVWLILSEPGGPYAEAASAVRRALGADAVVTERLPGALEAGLAPVPRAAVALGAGACAALAKSAIAPGLRLCALIPRNAFEAIARGARGPGRPLSAIVLDQPLQRQLALVRLALPERRRVAVLLGPDSAGEWSRLQSQAHALGLVVQQGTVSSVDELAPVLRNALQGADVLLAVPDAQVFNGRTIQNILLTTFRNRVPLVAFSASYVRAGALLALYSTPEQIGRQAGRALHGALRGRELPAAQSPDEYVVRSNPDVAQSLGIELDSDQSLGTRLRASEAVR